MRVYDQAERERKIPNDQTKHTRGAERLARWADSSFPLGRPCGLSCGVVCCRSSNSSSSSSKVVKSRKRNKASSARSGEKYWR